MRNASMLQLPLIINLGVFRGACACSCVHCPVGLRVPKERAAQFGRAEISLDLFRRYCSEVREIETTTRLHAVGEPTLHSHFTILLNTIREYHLQQKFWLFTCGVFEPSLAAQLIDSLGIIEVSINSTSREDYLRTKGVDRFDSVVRTVTAMRDLAAQRGLQTRIILTRVASDDSLDEQFVSYWRSRGFECFVRSYHSYSGMLVRLTRSAPVGEDTPPKCLVPWRRLNLDGTIVPDRILAVVCFNMLFCHPNAVDPKAILGDFPRASLIDLWNNASFDRFRRTLQCGESTFTSCDACTECLVDRGPRAEDVTQKGVEKC